MRRILNARRARHEVGAALVEYVLIAPLLLGLIFAAIDMSLLMWARMTLQYAVREGVRYAVVDQGNFQASPPCADVVGVIRKNSMGLVDTLHPTFEIQLNGRPSSATVAPDGSCPMNTFGARGDLVSVTLNAKWPLWTPFLPVPGPKFRFSVAATMRNEVN